jgi:hypothetical protein
MLVFERVLRQTCSMLAHVHSGTPSQRLSYDPGLHKRSGHVTGDIVPLTISQGREDNVLPHSVQANASNAVIPDVVEILLRNARHDDDGGYHDAPEEGC